MGSSHNGYESPLTGRYASREMSGNWSAQRKHSTWRRLWVALAESEKELGLNITQEQIDAIEEVIYLSEFHVKKQHFEQIVELDTKFHELLYASCGSKILGHLLRDYHQYVHSIRKITLSDPARAQNSNAEHSAILEAIRNRDADNAEKLAHEHIIQTIYNINNHKLV